MAEEPDDFQDQHPPKPTREGCTWVCNACPKRTPSLTEALDHVTEPDGSPFSHMMFEREGGTEEGRRFRRIVKYPLQSRAVVQTKKRRTREQQEA